MKHKIKIWDCENDKRIMNVYNYLIFPPIDKNNCPYTSIISIIMEICFYKIYTSYWLIIDSILSYTTFSFIGYVMHLKGVYYWTWWVKYRISYHVHSNRIYVSFILLSNLKIVSITGTKWSKTVLNFHEFKSVKQMLLAGIPLLF